MNQNEVVRRFIDMYKYRSFDLIEECLDTDVKWESAYVKDPIEGIELVSEYYLDKFAAMKKNGAKIIDYEEVLFSDKMIELKSAEHVDSNGKRQKIMVKQPSEGKSIIMGQLTHGENGVNLTDVLFNIKFNDEGMISSISILHDAFIRDGEYKSLGGYRLNDAWGKGIPEYTVNDFLRGRELLNFGIEGLIKRLESEGYKILAAKDDPESFPHIITKKTDVDGPVIGIYVKVDAAPNHPSLTPDIRLMMRKYSERTGFASAFAGLSFGSVDPDRFDAGLLLKYDGMRCKFNGIEWIVEKSSSLAPGDDGLEETTGYKQAEGQDVADKNNKSTPESEKSSEGDLGGEEYISACNMVKSMVKFINLHIPRDDPGNRAVVPNSVFENSSPVRIGGMYAKAIGGEHYERYIGLMNSLRIDPNIETYDEMINMMDYICGQVHVIEFPNNPLCRAFYGRKMSPVVFWAINAAAIGSVHALKTIRDIGKYGATDVYVKSSLIKAIELKLAYEGDAEMREILYDRYHDNPNEKPRFDGTYSYPKSEKDEEKAAFWLNKLAEIVNPATDIKLFEALSKVKSATMDKACIEVYQNGRVEFYELAAEYLGTESEAGFEMAKSAALQGNKKMNSCVMALDGYVLRGDKSGFKGFVTKWMDNPDNVRDFGLLYDKSYKDFLWLDDLNFDLSLFKRAISIGGDWGSRSKRVRDRHIQMSMFGAPKRK